MKLEGDPLAGPVVAGAVILPKDCNILYIKMILRNFLKRKENYYMIKL